ncbi:MAG: ATP-dependent Clp protease adaptor ClpS [Capnocytophaga sp.]|nr:ATP-dependent Clp protease adaptor ClpS [Capnocytophaga sp.]
MPETQSNPTEQQENELLTEKSHLFNIILYNDDFNTFDYVIKTLIEVCEHTPEQAEQCATIVHFSGKCPVKTGSYEDLLPRCAKLKAGGLTAEIHPCE